MCTLVESMGRIPTKDVRTLALAFLLLVTFAHGQVSCPTGMYSAWGGNWCCTSKCGPGTKIAQSCTHGNPANTICEDCGPDYYNPYPDQFHCRRKDLCNRDNEEVKIPGNSTANNECQCQIGFYDRAELCLSGPVCPPGSGATRTGTCENCPHGTFSNLTSHVQPCIPWQSCGLLGFLQHRPGTSTSDAVCISHPIDVLLPTERPELEINLVTHKEDVNNTDSMTGGRQQPKELNPVILGICVGVPALVLAAIVVLWFCRDMLCFCRETKKEIGLEEGQLDDSKTQLGVPEEEVGKVTNKGEVAVNMELEPLTGDYRDPTEEEANQAARPPDDGIETGDDSSTMSDSLSTLSRVGGAEPNSDVEETDPKLGWSTMQYSNLIAVDVDTTSYIVDHLGNMYLDLATCLPLRQGCSFTKTELDSLRHTYAFYGLKEAIRDTVNTWRTKQGEEASLEGLLVGLTACGKHGMVKDLCRMNNARRPNKGRDA